jgi:hypothetical protein
MSDRRREFGVQIAENIICKMKAVKIQRGKKELGITPFAPHERHYLPGS